MIKKERKFKRENVLVDAVEAVVDLRGGKPHYRGNFGPMQMPEAVRKKVERALRLITTLRELAAMEAKGSL